MNYKDTMRDPMTSRITKLIATYFHHPERLSDEMYGLITAIHRSERAPWVREKLMQVFPEHVTAFEEYVYEAEDKNGA